MRFMEKRWTVNGNDLIPWSLVMGIFFSFVLIVIRIGTVSSPVMGSDEYAYFHTAKYHDAGAQLYALDPNMQRVDNKIYPWLYKLWAVVSHDNAATVGRLFNGLAFCLGALLLYAIFIRLFDRRTALLSSLLYLLMPFSFFATTLLPEVEFQLFIYAIVLIWVCSGDLPRVRAVVLASVVSALGYLVKPHASAVILASAVYLLGVGTMRVDISFPARCWAGAWRAFCYLLLSAIMIKMFMHVLDAGGAKSMVASFYKGYLTRLLSPHYLLANMGSIGKYIAGHLWVWLIFFAPGMFCILRDGSRHLMRKVSPAHSGMPGEGSQREADATRARAAWLLLMLMAAMLCMVAAFTDAASFANDFEMNRLHGRYLEGLLPFLLAYSIWAARQTGQRYVAIAALAGLASFAWWGRSYFKLYPWDYPDIFGMYSPAPMAWSFDGALTWTFPVTAIAGGVCWLGYLFSRNGRAVAFYVVMIAGSMLAAHAQISAWLTSQDASSRQTLADGKAIRTFMGNVSAGSGLVATENRFGDGSYLLSALDSLQYVKWMAPNDRLESHSLPVGVNWVVTERSTNVYLPGAAELRFGNHRLFLLNRTYQWPEAPPKVAWQGSPITIDTSVSGAQALLHGFNDPEEWGSWTQSEDAYVELPVMVSQKVKLSFFGWVVDPRLNTNLRITLGDATKDIVLSGSGRDYELVLDTARPADRVSFEARVIAAPGAPRGLGVAIARIKLVRIDTQ